MSKEEIQALYEQFAPAVHRRALALLGRDADAWDVVHEVFEKVLRSAAAFRREARPMTYVYRITTNVCLNLIRSRGLREPAALASVPEEPSATPGSVEAGNFLRALMGELTDRAREVAVLHFLDDLTQEEIAEVLGLSRKTIQRDLEEIRARASALEAAERTGHG